MATAILYLVVFISMPSSEGMGQTMLAFIKTLAPTIIFLGGLTYLLTELAFRRKKNGAQSEAVTWFLASKTVSNFNMIIVDLILMSLSVSALEQAIGSVSPAQTILIILSFTFVAFFARCAIALHDSVKN
jgi:hypothetical protein